MQSVLSKISPHIRTICQSIMLSVALCLAPVMVAASETQAKIEHNAQHLGVASCSSSTCHGSVKEFADSNVLQNEFRTWFEKDPHAQAYNTLLTAQSQEIAQKLGLESAHTADMCLGCHSDLVAAPQRGTEFRLEDGVGCESCHGGAEHYLKSHTFKNHADNLKAGLRKTEDPTIRGKLCVSCHVGEDANRRITHTIMGAGHPRLSIELNTFSSIQPAHYRVDSDYIDRKGPVNELHMWAAGQVVAASQLLHNLESSPRSGLFPELAHMDCLTCHQSMRKLTWSPDPVTQLRPGALRYQDAHLMMSYRISNVVAPDIAPDLLTAIKKFLRSATKLSDFETTHSPLLAHLQTLQRRLNERPINSAQGMALVNNLLEYGVESGHNSYASAEQLVMGLNSLLRVISTTNLNNANRQPLAKQINRLFDTVAAPEHYNARQFVAQLKRMQQLSSVSVNAIPGEQSTPLISP